jgi:hypothetical protein
MAEKEEHRGPRRGWLSETEGKVLVAEALGYVLLRKKQKKEGFFFFFGGSGVFMFAKLVLYRLSHISKRVHFSKGK